jgi:hypothetical protein
VVAGGGSTVSLPVACREEVEGAKKREDYKQLSKYMFP